MLPPSFTNLVAVYATCSLEGNSELHRGYREGTETQEDLYPRRFLLSREPQEWLKPACFSEHQLAAMQLTLLGPQHCCRYERQRASRTV